MMSSLLADVIAAPDDDTPRLVYADFLQERGEVLRGELIVVQCQRERLEREEKTTTLEYRQACWREKQLLARVEGDYRRGFVHRLTMPTPSARALLEIHEPLLETIVFRGDGALAFDAQKLLAIAPDLPLDEPLWLPERGLPHPALVPALVGVRFALPTERTIRDLIDTDAPSLRALTCLGSLQFTGDACDDYVKTPSFERLDRLELWRLEDRELTNVLMHARATKHLTLVRDDDEAAPSSIHPIFQNCRAIAHVRDLHVSVAYRRESIERLGEEAVHLERWVASDGIAPDAWEALTSGPLPARLRHLEVSSFNRDSEVVRLITAPWRRLTSLAVGNTKIGMELPTAPALESLVELRLFGCQIEGDVEDAIRARWPRARIE